MNRNTLLTDVGIAALLAILAIVIAPGLAVVGLLAILVIVLCAVSFALDRRRRRQRHVDVRVSRPPRRAQRQPASRSQPRPRPQQRSASRPQRPSRH